MFEGFVAWLENTPLSLLFGDTSNFWTWLIVPSSQAVHILAVSVVMMAIGMMTLRLLGIAGTQQSFSQLSRHFMPWLWTALIVLFLTGTILTIAEPGRELLNSGFKLKMILLTTALALLMLLERAARSHPNYWQQTKVRQTTSRLLALLSIFLWIGIAAAGRMIAYVDTRY